MKTGKSYATVILKPHKHTAPLGVDVGMVWAGDAVAIPAAGDNEKGFERPSLQKLTNICDHFRFSVIQPARLRKLGKPDVPEFGVTNLESLLRKLIEGIQQG